MHNCINFNAPGGIKRGRLVSLAEQDNSVVEADGNTPIIGITDWGSKAGRCDVFVPGANRWAVTLGADAVPGLFCANADGKAINVDLEAAEDGDVIHVAGSLLENGSAGGMCKALLHPHTIYVRKGAA